MVDPARPSEGALEEARRLAGPAARIERVARLEGGQHARTWRVDTAMPALSVVVREFPVGDPAGVCERRVLGILDGLGGLAPVLLASDLNGRWSPFPTLLTNWLDGEADIAPTDPDRWARQLGEALATVHATVPDRLAALPSVFERAGGARELLAGPVAAHVRSRWSQITAARQVLTHNDYWSGNVVWRDGMLTGIVDWSGAARGPRGYDVGWCRLDLYLLFDEHVTDVFLAAYEARLGGPLPEIALWDAWATARSHAGVESWSANYQPLGGADLDPAELRRRHSRWTHRLLQRA